MDKDDNRMLLFKFDYDPIDHSYKVKFDHASDFMDPNRKAKPSEEPPIVLPNNAIISAGNQQYDSVMYSSAEQRRRAELIPPKHIALSSSAEDAANARIIYGVQRLHGGQASPCQRFQLYTAQD